MNLTELKKLAEAATPGPWKLGDVDDALGYDCMTAGIEVGPVTLDCADYGQETCTAALAFLFAIETACRAGEIVGIRREHIYPKHVHLPMTKNGQARDVPLSPKAREILEIAGRDFKLSSQQLDALFRKAKKRAGVDATFHDSRRTALTRLSKVFTNPLELARISGHRNLTQIITTYYAPSVEDLADKFSPSPHQAGNASAG